MNNQPLMYVRYIGTKACWTLPDGRFYMGYQEELTDQERQLCNNGGGYLPLSQAVETVAR